MTGMMTVEQIKAEQARLSADIRAKILERLAQGEASTTELRDFAAPQFSRKHKRTVFWNYIQAARLDGAIVKSGERRENDQQYPTALWRLP